LKQGDLIAALHPEAAKNFRRLCHIYGGMSLAERVSVIPHSISPSLAYEQVSPPKQNRIIAIGRWDDVIQKRPALLTEVIGRLLSQDEYVAVDLVGNLTERINAWQHSLPPDAARRVCLYGKLPHGEIRRLLLTARILYCPSAYESFHIASAEALCCGCSVVAADKPALASLRWFVSRDSGTLAATDEVQGHLDALERELALWETGRRDPMAISRTWCETLHADKVAERIIKVIAEHQNPR
jgi:glycosyltransferase involved in cell wall biosynthesis